MYVWYILVCCILIRHILIIFIYLFAYELIIRKLCLCLRLCVSASPYSSDGIKISVVDGGVLGRARLEGISSKNINLQMSVRSAASLPSTKRFLKILVKVCSSRVPDGANMYDLN